MSGNGNHLALVGGEYSGGVPEYVQLAILGEGPARRPQVFLPGSVQAWMIYTVSGEMRAHAFKEANYADTVNGWTIYWDVKTKEYCVTKKGRAVIRTTRKHEAYVVAYSNGQHRPQHHG